MKRKKKISVSKKNINSSNKSWSYDEEKFLFAAREEGIPYRLIGLDLKRSTRSCEWKYNNTRWEEKDYYDPNSRKMRVHHKKELQNAIMRLQNRREELSRVKMDIIADRLETAVSPLPEVPKPFYIGPSKSKSKTHNNPEDVGLALGDCHIGAEFFEEETGGLSEYNVDVFLRRMENLKKSMTHIYELHSQLYQLPNLHIFGLGDFVAGMNDSGSWSPTYINSPIYDQAIVGCEAIADLINYSLGMFEKVTFYGVQGNHGRAAMKGREKEYVNWDFITYKFLESRLKDNPRIQFQVPKTWWILATIRKHKFLVLHGDDIKGGNLKSVEEHEKKFMTMIKTIPDYTIVGHFHNAGEWSTNNGKVLINGSFVGPDMFSLKSLTRSGKPEQKIFGIHDKRGITWRYDIDLDIEA